MQGEGSRGQQPQHEAACYVHEAAIIVPAQTLLLCTSWYYHEHHHAATSSFDPPTQKNEINEIKKIV